MISRETTLQTPAGPRSATIEGMVAPGFEPVLEAFEECFRRDGEIGASLAIEVDGLPVVDLWGGLADPGSASAWEKDTVCVVFSNTKPATALCAHLLAEAGELDLDQPVSRIWPAFGSSDKREMTPRMFLDHSAGLPVLRDPLPDGSAFDFDYMTRRLEREQPFWRPGTRVGYHAITFGWLVGELIRRVSGRMPGDFFREQIAVPLDLDFWIGLPESEERRVAPIIPPPAPESPSAFDRAVMEEPDSIPALYLRNSGGWRPQGFNTRAGHAAHMCASGGITNARALARLYGTLALGGTRDGFRLLKEEALLAAAEVSSATHLDATLLVPTRFGAGFMRQMDNRRLGLDGVLIGRDGYGHCGAGGSVAFASPGHRLGFAYVMNRMGSGVLLNSRADRLVEAMQSVMTTRLAT
jgi:CubicO group peptidase (beta-lactamase class C family)